MPATDPHSLKDCQPLSSEVERRSCLDFHPHPAEVVPLQDSQDWRHWWQNLATYLNGHYPAHDESRGQSFTMEIAHQTEEPLLVAEYIRQAAAREPDRVVFSAFRSKSPHDGYVNITVLQIRQAVDFASQWIEETLGIGTDHPTIAYIGTQDVRYLVLALAAAEAGWKLFTPSPRNSLEANLELFATLDCNVFLHSEDYPPALSIANLIQAHRALQVVAAPSQSTLVNAKAAHRQSRVAPQDTFVVFHTSGTTGLPKPVVIPQGAVATSGSFARRSSEYQSYMDAWRGLRVFLLFPYFHAAGLMHLTASIYYGFIPLFKPNLPPSADLAKEAIQNGDVQVAGIPPSVLVEMSEDPAPLSALGSLQYVATGGGPLPGKAGDRISPRTHLVTMFGCTESGLLSNGLADPEDWAYLNFSPFLGMEMRPRSDNLFESVFVRRPDSIQAVFQVFPHLTEFSTRDLWSKHPTKNLWKHEGREDDIIVYSTGLKFNPTTMESVIGSHPNVSAALVLGHGRFQSVLLLEPRSYPHNLVEDIMPLVHEANRGCAANAQIKKGFIIITQKDKPLPRASKGTVQRRPSEKLYSDEIDRLFEHETNGSKTIENGDVDDMVLSAISECSGVRDILPTENLFERGFDSLSVRTLTRALNSITTALNKPITPKLIYANPTAQDLTAYLKGAVSNVGGMEEVFQRFTRDLPLNATKRVVLLTGSSGSLGSFLLDQLIHCVHVSKIYCLNRGSHTKARQQTASREKGLIHEFPIDRVEFLDSETPSSTTEYLGLPVEAYKQLLSEVTDVIHNAWQVDFNLALVSYADTHVRRVRQLIDFSSQSTHSATIHFISSIGTVTNFQGPVPELVYQSSELPEKIGYAEAKFVSERILDAASAVSGVPTYIYRVGQIAGPTTEAGMWNRNEWFPLILRSSKALGALPQSLGPYECVDWLPVDLLAKALTELAVPSPKREIGENARVYHLVNPRKTNYEALFPTISEHLDLPGVPLEEWVARLSRSASQVTPDIPALRLLDFYQGLSEGQAQGKMQCVLETTRAERDSATLRNMEPVNTQWITNWLRQLDI